MTHGAEGDTWSWTFSGLEQMASAQFSPGEVRPFDEITCCKGSCRLSDRQGIGGNDLLDLVSSF